jgi:phospholipid transport system transporter-binding protein
MSDQLSVRMSGDCTVRSIRTLHRQIATALETTAKLDLDCAAVERADIAFVQLVLSAAATATRQAKELTLVDPSEVVRSAFVRAGLQPQAPFVPAI